MWSLIDEIGDWPSTGSAIAGRVRLLTHGLPPSEKPRSPTAVETSIPSALTQGAQIEAALEVDEGRESDMPPPPDCAMTLARRPRSEMASHFDDAALLRDHARDCHLCPMVDAILPRRYALLCVHAVPAGSFAVVAPSFDCASA